jgi:hypothetical protein
MVRNGDAHKPIWLSEMAWNAAPIEFAHTYGHASLEQQARYAVLAYQRIQQEWPWLGVANYWFLKQATDQELKDGNPQYFFRLLEPDFTPMPAYEALKAANTQPPVMYRGYHQEDHWAIRYSEQWRSGLSEQAVLGQVKQSTAPGATVSFTFSGSTLQLVALPAQTAGRLQVQIDDRQPRTLTISPATAPRRLPLLRTLQPDEHRVRLTVLGEAPVRVDGFVVYTWPRFILGYLGSFIMLGAALVGFFVLRRQKAD